MFMLLIVSCALAHDWKEREGEFLNLTNQDLFCYGDCESAPGKLCALRAKPSESCKGDAVGTREGARVFKVPNRTRYTVSMATGRKIVISASDAKSAMIYQLAIIKNGKDKYGLMKWKAFTDLMQKSVVVECSK